MRVSIVLNPRSGAVFRLSGRPSRERVARVFEALGVETSFEPVPHGDLRRAVAAAAARKPDAVVVGGGDGSINTAAEALAGSDVPLGVLPLGTFNYFARLLCIPMDLEGAAATVAGGQAERLDVVDVNGVAFVSHSSVGIFPRYILERTLLQARRGWRKAPAMAAALVKSLWKFPVLDITIQAEGVERTARTPFLLVGNSLYAINPLALGCGKAEMQDGTFSLYLGRARTRRELVRAVYAAMRGRIDLKRDFELLELSECEVRSERQRLLLTADGEVMGLKPPLRYRIRPGALRIMIPAARPEGVAGGR